MQFGECNHRQTQFGECNHRLMQLGECNCMRMQISECNPIYCAIWRIQFLKLGHEPMLQVAAKLGHAAKSTSNPMSLYCTGCFFLTGTPLKS